MTDFKTRILRSLKLDREVYREVEHDEKALPQAMFVVVLSSVAAGLGSHAGGRGLLYLVTITVISLILWYVWAFLTFVIGTKLLPVAETKADMGQLLRTIGFSSSPGLIRVLGFIPGFSVILFPVASVWMLVAMVVAVREALDYKSTLRAFFVCAIGWIVQVLIFGFLIFLLYGRQMMRGTM